jgi:hypothetical protein
MLKSKHIELYCRAIYGRKKMWCDWEELRSEMIMQLYKMKDERLFDAYNCGYLEYICLTICKRISLGTISDTGIFNQKVKFDELKGGNNIGDLNEDDEDFNLSVSQLFEFIDSDEKEQFIQDFRNTIDYYIHSGTWSTDGVTDRILRARDIEYYKKHIYLEEDTEAKSKYEYRNKTVWFPRGINPVRTGIYEVSELDYQNAKHDGYAYWNGKTWFDKKILLKDCAEQKRTKENEKSWGSYCWRGFLEQLTN